MATFLGRKLTGNYRDELGNDFSTGIEAPEFAITWVDNDRA